MEYDYLKIKNYSGRVENNQTEIYYVLSFSNQHHVKVSETTKKIIDLFDGNCTFEQIKERIISIGIMINDEELKKFIKKTLVDKAMLEGTNYIKKNGNTMLWLKIPLIESDKLKAIFNVLKYLFNYKAMVLCIILIIISCTYSIYKVTAETPNVKEMNSLMVFVLGYLSLFLHEFGHISAAYRCNIRAGKIGIGIYMITPVMYVNMTNAWRLDSRKRVLIDLGGMYFQSLFTVPITICAIVSGNNMYYICSILIVAMTLYNMIPFLKLDGYWLFCDYFKLDNVSVKAFRLMRNVIKDFVTKDGLEKGEGKRERKIYYIFSFIYSFSILFMVGVGFICAVITIRNWDTVICLLHEIVLNIKAGNITYALNGLNNVLVYLIPIIFIGIMVIRTIIKVTIKMKGKNNG